ncbi:MAG: hypothetical protein ABJF23_08745 [Bryobacteraceae bacterium]
MHLKSKPAIVALLACVIPSAAQPQSLQKLAGGVEFHSPAQWQTKISGDAAVVAPPDAKLMPDQSPAELYIVSLLAGVKDLKDPRLGELLEGKYLPAGTKKALAAPKQFQAKGGVGYLHVYEFQQQGTKGRLDVYTVEFPQGGVAAVIAAGTSELIAGRFAPVATMAASLSRAAAAASSAPAPAGSDDSPAVRQWDQRLRGKKMVQMSSYSSGSSGGSSSSRAIALAADGTYTYRSSSSVSIYVDGANGGSNGQKSDAGTWRLYEQAGNVILEMKSSKGETSTGVLTSNGTKTLLNNVRWFVVGMNE